jgi:WD40 repeat protein
MPQRLRVFISSPGDVPDERLRADLVIDKLAQDYSRFFTIESYRWEHEPMLASGHFQDAIDPPSVFDIVVLILWSRLGTSLPLETKVRKYRGIDDRAPVTGTEWEFEDALIAARDKGAPDILAFRNVNPVPIDTQDLDAQARDLSQLNSLNAFWTRHFADRGIFIAAYDRYRTTEEFAERFEQSVRKLIERRIKALGTTSVDQNERVWLGAPFRGLQAYEFEHAAIYFGRDALVAKAMAQLTAQARAGTAFLLVSGASGSGKSSMVNAALVPRLMKPQRIEGASFVRRLGFKPSEGGNNLILALVEALVRGSAEQGIGLPELLAPGQKAADLSEQLAMLGNAPGFAFKGALARVTEAGRAAGKLLGYEDAKLILVIDQLEELFTAAAISAEERQRFVRLLAALASCGMVWVVATIRADFWHRVAEMPDLAALCEGQGRLDVAAPSAAELAEMIRRPAQAAGLSFEKHTEKGLGLDVVLAEHAASAPGVLPLLSFTLDVLYAEDVVKRGGHVLTYATYEALGGLEGAIATRADETVAQLPESARGAVARVLRALVTVSADANEALVARVEPIASFEPGTDARAVVDALVEARLLVASSEGSEPTVRVAHEALISRWQRAANQLLADRRDIETRHLSERQMTRWASAAGSAKRQLLLHDPDLANALDLGQRWGDELPAPLRSFIATSADAAKRAARIRWAAAFAVMVCLAALAAASFGALYIAEIQRNDALIAESHFLAHDARNAVESGNATLGALLALAGLPDDVGNPNRPFVKDAEYALEDAVANIRERLVLEQQKSIVWTAAWSPDGSRMVTASDDGTARLWDAASGKVIAVLQGHAGTVWSAAFSPDGTRIVTASSDRTARLWDAATGMPVAVLEGHEETVSSASFSLDGLRIVTASDDKSARLWDARTGAPIAVMRGHTGLVTSAVFSADGGRVVTGSTDNTARIWDGHSGAEIATLRGHEGWISLAAFSPDARRIVTASWDNTARLWNADTGAVIAELRAHEGMVIAAAFSPDGTRVVTGSTDTTARIWNGVTGASIDVLKGHGNWVTSAIFSSDGRHVLTASNDGSARIWDAVGGAMIGVLRGHDGIVNSAAFSPDGNRIVTASTDDTARVWSAEIHASEAVLRGHAATVTAAAFSPDGTRLLTGSIDKTAVVWDARALSPLLTVHDSAVRSAAFSPDGSHILTGSVDGKAQLWDAKTGVVLREFAGHAGVVVAQFSPDGARIVTASADHNAIVWDTETATKLVTLAGHDNWVTTAAFSPDGRRVLTTSWDETARLWDATTGVQLKVFKGHEGRVGSGAFSPDGARVATASWDKTARIWNVDSGAQIAVLRGHTNMVNSVAFSPDGARVVTSSLDRTAIVWDAVSGAAITVLKGHDNWVTSAMFSPDGSHVITSSADTTARLWTMPPHCQSLIDAARNGRLRDPTGAERAQYFLAGPPAGGAALATFNRWFAPVLPKEGETCQ